MANGKILVIDDDALNRIKLSTNLEDAGYTVLLAENGRLGLDAMRRESPDAVLLDLHMPVLDGFGVMQEIQGDAGLQHLPIIVISADDDMSSIVRCIEMGAADHLPKPFNPVILRARVSACVEKKRLHDRERELFTELQERYRQLQELEKLRDDLTNMIVHDLRTPLTSLLTGLMSIPPLGEMSELQSECLDMATAGGHRLLSQINQLLDISKLENGSLQLQLSTVDAADVIADALAQVRELAEDKGLSLRTSIAAGLPAVSADAEKLEGVLVNLCGNAIKFTPRGGTITVSADAVSADAVSADAVSADAVSADADSAEADSAPADAPHLRFAVTDTGEGIPAEYLDRIFEKFGQVESRQGGRTASSGLGLTFCKMIVERHGGHISVQSEPGRGSTFMFTI